MIEASLYIQTAQTAYEIPLNGERLTIGRSDAVTLKIDDSGLSRIHASIYRQAEMVWIVDENSRNGCLVNDSQVPPGGTLLNDGDLITIGNHTTITVRLKEFKRKLVPAHVLAQIANQSGAQVSSNKSNLWSPPIIAAASAVLIIILAAVALITIHAFKSDEEVREPRLKPRPIADQPLEEDAGDSRVKDEISIPETVATSAVPSSTSAPNAEKASSEETMRQALLRVVEDRQEPMGYEAIVEVPAELKHYSERRRFLAVQTAEAIQQNLHIPHDFSELITLIQSRQLVELKQLGDNYVVYGLGSVSDEEFTHYDRIHDRSVPLYRSTDELQIALKNIPEKDERREAIVSFYKDKKAFQLAASEYDRITQFARDFDGQFYDLNDAVHRRQLKQRLLSFIRPAAQSILEEIASAYKQKFNRPLPIASIIRTEEYQRQLSERNVNAAHNALPPHTTGLAFDISYRYMTAAEQSFLMAEIARLKTAGRVEALRENNNCFHIFAFVDGRPPLEAIIKKSMG